MRIHFLFGQIFYRTIKISCAPVRAPVGRLAEIVAHLQPGLPREDFFKEGIRNNKHFRRYISEVLLSGSKLYFYEPNSNRGRLGKLNKIPSQQLSLMLASQEKYGVGLPSHQTSWWVPDAKGQDPDFTSVYVRDALMNDALYISGYSGMTAVLLGQMEIMGNLSDVRFKQLYLAAIAAYIVGGGFHSLHEVIGPAQYGLQLVPDYNVRVPLQKKMAPPPNDHVFFQLLMKIDPEFKLKREEAWQRYLEFFEKIYLPIQHKTVKVETKELPRELKSEVAITTEELKSKLSIEIQTKILSELDNYIKSREGKIISSPIVGEKIHHARYLKKMIKEIIEENPAPVALQKLTALIEKAKNDDAEMEKKFQKQHSHRNINGFARGLLPKIEGMVQEEGEKDKLRLKSSS
jgi:hypothetical protein